MKHTGLLLETWQVVGRHPDLQEVLRRLVPVLQRHLPLASAWLRQADLARCAIETRACVGVGLPEQQVDLAPFLAWHRAGSLVRASAAELRQAVPGLLPPDLEADTLVLPLGEPDLPLALVVAAPPGRCFQPRHEAVLRCLREPLTAAIANDRRLQELTERRAALEADNQSLLMRLGKTALEETIIGVQGGLREVMQQVEMVSRSEVPVLILGETGSGKEVIARAIHSRSQRKSGPFVRVNCGAIPAELIDSELFGHERGSFTGAVNERKGWFERADGGTLFLDECGELPAAVQVRLLRVLQDGTFERVGGEQTLQVSVRIVAATHRDLRAMTGDGRFRQDLWFRLAVFPVRLPPLRERPEDIPALVEHFVERACRRLGQPLVRPTATDLKQLAVYPWPGNVRELAAVLERAVILGEGKVLKVDQALGIQQGPAPVPPATSVSLDEAVVQHIEAALVQARGRVEGPTGAARLLGVNPHTLRSRMRKLGIDWSQFRESA